MALFLFLSIGMDLDSLGELPRRFDILFLKVAPAFVEGFGQPRCVNRDSVLQDKRSKAETFTGSGIDNFIHSFDVTVFDLI